MKLNIKSIHRVQKKLAAGGVRTYYYYRPTGTRLVGEFASPEFIESYAAAEKAARAPRAGDRTFTTLIRRFENSPAFADLSQASREAYKQKFRRVEDKWGTCPIEAVEDPEFRRDAIAWRDELGLKSRRSADNLLASVARVLSFAVEAGEIEVNQLATFKRIYKVDRSEMVWSDELVAKFMASARPAMRTAMMLVRNIGLRQKDIRTLPWSAYDGTTIEIRTSKKGRKIKTPCPRELKEYLDAQTRNGLLILTTPTGRAYTKRYFNEHWREDADLVEAGDLNFHDNRGTAATRLAEAGATASMIAAIMGWKHDRAQRVIDAYIAANNSLAAAGIELLEAHRAKNGLQSQ